MHSIEFKELPIPEGQGPKLFKIYYVIENGHSLVIDKYKSLPERTRKTVKTLIIRMATEKNFKSFKIKYNLKGYNYGEIKPMPHRFFFFKTCGNNYIFFDYELKKTDSLPNKVYREINQKKERYENEFKKFIQGC
jgi:hypothetical protein